MTAEKSLVDFRALESALQKISDERDWLKSFKAR
jgi:hypothetical protein